MNGRIYDPLLGRMLSADVLVQNPGDLQAYNRYSYVKNNPLTFIDPTGFATYEQNRDIGQNEVTSNWDYLSHTFVFTTNKDGTLKDTYSWGNSANSHGWNKNQPEDRKAAQDALDKEQSRVDAAAKRKWIKAHIPYLDKVGEDDIDPYVDDAYNDLNKPENEHVNLGLIRNCKAEAGKLTDLAKKKQEEANAQAAAKAASDASDKAQGDSSSQTPEQKPAAEQKPTQTPAPPQGNQDQTQPGANPPGSVKPVAPKPSSPPPPPDDDERKKKLKP